MRNVGFMSSLVSLTFGSLLREMPVLHSGIPTIGRAKSQRRHSRTSRYMPHQGERECARRVRQGLSAE